MVDCLDDVFVIAREVKERSTFARRAKLGKNIFRCQRHEVLRRVQSEFRSQVTEYPRCVIFELEVVFGAWCQFVAGNIEAELVFCVKIGISKLSVQFGISPADGEADSSKHVIRSDIVDMVLVNFRSHHNSVIVGVHSCLFGGSLGLDVFCPSRYVFVLWDIIMMYVVRIY